MKYPGNRARRGWTLVELLVVISIVSVLLASVTVIIQKIVRQDAAFGKDLAHQRVMERLADQFRRDVHTAVRVEGLPVATDSAGTEHCTVQCLGAEGPPVVYERHGRRLVRTATDASGRETHRSFPVPPGATVRLVRDGRAEPPLAALEIAYPAGFALPTGRADRGTKRQWTIEAAVGRDLRWRALEKEP